MLLKDMFAKKIDRELQGVIVVGQDDHADVRQELEEYVVTNELQKHFRDFFANYKKSIVGTTPKMGVWISGFFGSGKSHFLKILSYLLENKEVGGKKALDYFKEDHKIEDAAVFADMQLAAQTPTDVISFNIAAKSDTGSKNKEAIVKVFLRVFNEMQGFCGAIPWVADLERRLSEKGRYDEFKEAYCRLSGDVWEESRNDFDYIQDDVVAALAEIGFMTETAARNWCENAAGEFTLSIEDFAARVQDYLDHKEKKHHIVFLIDEVGQYIGDDSRLMLDLQTVTEELGKQCGGNVWIVVTSQQDIDKITKVRGNDFSKIQGRFDTRLSLSSANVDAIIKKRILEKTETADQSLRLWYGQEDTAVKNLITFNDTAEKKLYADDADFAAVYPFIPYQFDVLAKVLTSVRTHGAAGKHLSEGERSMLAMFKEAAMAYAGCEQGTIIPLHAFYDAMENFLDHSHRSVIAKAYENSRINPNGEGRVFAVDVLKTLFLIKYVDIIRANIDNLTTLMIDRLDEDRIAVKSRVEKALEVLINQSLVQKNGDIYVFLTNEEQEINREIRNENVEFSEITRKTAELIFDDIFTDKKYRYPKFNGRYTFAFDEIVDEYSHKQHSSSGISVHVLTPADDTETDEMTLRVTSGQEQSVLIVLPPDQQFIDELRFHLQIKKFLQRSTSSESRYGAIKESKGREMQEREETAKIFLKESLKKADIYVNGSRADIGAKDIAARMNDALGKLVQNVYSKLPYIDTAMDDDDVRKALHSDSSQTMDLSSDKEANGNALDDVLQYITGNTKKHMKTSMKTLKDYFMKKPYGFVDNDVEWLAARLFKRGDLSFYVNGEMVTLASCPEKTVFEYLTKRQYAEALLMERRERVSDKEKRAVKNVLQKLFAYPTGSDDEDVLMTTFRSQADKMNSRLKDLSRSYDQQPAYPGFTVVTDGKKLLENILQPRTAKDFFAAVKMREDELLDLGEDIEPVQKFFESTQKEHFDRAWERLKIYDDSSVYIVDEELEQVVQSIRDIIEMLSPYSNIYKLPELVNEFNLRYMTVLEKEAVPVNAAVNDARARVMEVLDGKSYKDEKKETYGRQFEALLEEAQRSNNVNTLRSCKDKAETLKIRLLNEMEKKDAQLAREAAEKEKKKEAASGEKIVEQPKPYHRKISRTISIRSVVTANSWRIQSPEDVDAYVNELKKELLKTLDADTIINVEF